ncbi:MAG: prolyl oligopeptidase family serine peptidase [Pacificimonas sp.]
MNARRFVATLVFIASSLAGPAIADGSHPEPYSATEAILDTALAKDAHTRPAAELFIKPPLISNTILSPDGERLVGIFNVGDDSKLGLLNISTNDIQILPDVVNERANRVHWAGNDRLLFTTIHWFNNQYFVLDLTNMAFREVGKDRRKVLSRLIHIEPDGQSALVHGRETIFRDPSVYRIDLATGQLDMVQRRRAGVDIWRADNSGVIRYGLGLNKKKWKLVYRQSAADKFRTVAKARYDDEDALIEASLLLAGRDDAIVLTDTESDTAAIYEYDFLNRRYGKQVFADPDHDVDAVVSDARTGQLLGARVVSDYARTTWFDDGMKAVQAGIDSALADRLNTIVDFDQARDVFVIKSQARGDAGELFVYINSERRLQRLAFVNDYLPQDAYSPSEYVKVPTRDGETMYAVLTRPRKQDGPGSLLVMPHGGPFGVRDDLSYNPDVQFFASRGYTVLQPNFRGSGGYGKRLLEAGEGTIGRAMQDDIDDAAGWAVEEGIADADRICLIGASYGGYAALWGATRSPDRYRCAVSLVGVTDYETMLKYDSKSLRRRSDRERLRAFYVDEEDEDLFDLDSVSPLRQIARLEVPVLLLHGGKDRTVPMSQFESYRDALTAAGKHFEAYVYEESGHGFTSDEDHIDYLERVATFLTKHNPAN